MFCTPGFRFFFRPFFSSNPLKVCQDVDHVWTDVSWFLQDWVQVQALARPFSDIRRVSFLCCGCVIRVIVLSEGEHSVRSEVLSALDQVFVIAVLHLASFSFPSFPSLSFLLLSFVSAPQHDTTTIILHHWIVLPRWWAMPSFRHHAWNSSSDLRMLFLTFWGHFGFFLRSFWPLFPMKQSGVLQWWLSFCKFLLYCTSSLGLRNTIRFLPLLPRPFFADSSDSQF